MEKIALLGCYSEDGKVCAPSIDVDEEIELGQEYIVHSTNNRKVYVFDIIGWNNKRAKILNKLKELGYRILLGSWCPTKRNYWR